VQPGEARPSDSSLSVFTLNVHGELSRGVYAIMQDAQHPYDIFVFTETWLAVDAKPPELEGYDAFNHTRPRRNDGRRRGGICVYIKQRPGLNVTTVYVHPDTFYMSLRLVFASKPARPQAPPLQIFCCYFPPDDGRTLSRSKTAAVWESFSDHVAEAIGLGHVLVVGDLNARTAAEPDYPAVAHVFTGMEELFSTDRPPLCSVRCSADTGPVNTAGRRLLGMCKRTNMRIVNGRKPGDEQGAVTFPASNGGGSLVDYVLASPALMPLIPDLHVLPAPSSDHQAVTFHVRVSAPPPTPAPASSSSCAALVLPARMRGTKDIASWVAHLSTAQVKAQVAQLTAQASGGSAAVQALGEAFDGLVHATWSAATSASTAAKAAAAPRHPRTKLPQPKWWTHQLTLARKAARRALRCQPQAAASLQLRRSYQRLLKQARATHHVEQGAIMAQLWQKEPNSFWQLFNSSKKSSVPIPLAAQHAYFSTLLSIHPAAVPTAAAPLLPSSATIHQRGSPTSPPSIPIHSSLTAATQPPTTPKPPTPPHKQTPPARTPQPPLRPAPLPPLAPPADSALLDRPISESEVVRSISKLKNGKSTVGQLSTAALQQAAPQLAAPFAAVFNACATEGSLPALWALCTITAVHKGGDATDIGNYRGIAVGSFVCLFVLFTA
jgi:hypothetical protein